MKITIPANQRHDQAFSTLQVTEIIILSNTEGNPSERSLSAKIVAIPVAEPIPENFIYSKTRARTIKIPDLWEYLMANPEIAFYLLTALTKVIADQVGEWDGVTLEIPDA